MHACYSAVIYHTKRSPPWPPSPPGSWVGSAAGAATVYEATLYYTLPHTSPNPDLSPFFRPKSVPFCSMRVYGNYTLLPLSNRIRDFLSHLHLQLGWIYSIYIVYIKHVLVSVYRILVVNIILYI